MDNITVRAAARRLGVGYSTMKAWIYQGRVRTVRTPGGHHRIEESEIERLLARRDASDGPARATPKDRRRPGGVIVALSGRNQLRGFVEEVRSDGLLSQVRLRVGDQSLTAVITRDAITELKLRRGDEAVAIVKSTEVMIAREASASPAPRSARAAAAARSARLKR